jgi:hypothetical protein
MGSVFQLPKLKRDKSGAWRGRKALPVDVRAEYAALYKARREAIFWRLASTPAAQAKAEFADWLALVERRIASIRAARGGKGRDITQREADALAGVWYRCYVDQHLDHPGEPNRWETLRDLLFDIAGDPETGALDLDRSEVLKGVEVEARTPQFLLDHGVALSPSGTFAFLRAVAGQFIVATETLQRRAGGDWSKDEHLSELLPPDFYNGHTAVSGHSAPTR